MNGADPGRSDRAGVHRRRRFLAAFVAFLVAALVIVALMFALALILAVAQERTIEEIKAGAPAVKKWGGRILVAVGAWFIALAVFADFFADVFPV